MEKIGSDGQIDGSDLRPTNSVYEGFTYFRKGDVIIAKITPCFENGKGAWLTELPTEYGFGTTELHVFRPVKIYGGYLFQLLNRKNFLAQGEEFMVGSAGQKRIPTEFLANYLFGCPPIDEQREICGWIKNLSSKMNKVIQREADEIERLRELMRVLIAETVAGQIKV